MVVYAEQANYWQTSETKPNDWFERAQKEIEAAGGIFRRVVQDDVKDPKTGQLTTYTIEFQIGGREMRVAYQTLESKYAEPPSRLTARRVQAATALYYDVKARCVDAKFHGVDHAFLPYIVMKDGRTLVEGIVPELAAMALPALPAGK